MRFGPFIIVGNRSVGWFRLFGYGIAWADRAKFPPLFSERMGYVRTVVIRDTRFKFLRPSNLGLIMSSRYDRWKQHNTDVDDDSGWTECPDCWGYGCENCENGWVPPEEPDPPEPDDTMLEDR